MFAFLRKQKPLTKVASPFPMGYTPAEFKSNPGLVSMAESFRRSALGGHIFAALHNGVPYGYPQRGLEVNPTTAAIELGRVQGYMDCLQLFHSLCIVPEMPKEVPQDYGAEDLLKLEGLPTE